MSSPSPFPRLTKDASVEARCEVANKIAEQFANGEFGANEKRIAIEIFRVLVLDVERNVRRILSEKLAPSLEAPHDVILKLAKDEGDIAIPVLKKSFVLTEADLIDITANSQNVEVMSVIARREMISRELSEALIKKGNVAVISELLENNNATIDEQDLYAIYHNQVKNPPVLELMAKRGGIPIALAEKLFVAVSDEVKRVLTSHYNISIQTADDSSSFAREMATLGLVDDRLSGMEIADLVTHLHHSKRLTLSLIIRALCAGNLRFFEHAFAELAEIPYPNARILILDGGAAFEALYRKSVLPNEMFPAISYLLRAALVETELGRYQWTDFKQRLVSRLIKDETANHIENMDYIVRIIQSNNFEQPL